jgi:hypothetical protein
MASDPLQGTVPQGTDSPHHADEQTLSTAILSPSRDASVLDRVAAGSPPFPAAFSCLVPRLLRWAWKVIDSRPPDYVIQPDGHSLHSLYLERWRVVESKLAGVKVHRVHRSDDDRALHDHPWTNLSIVLSGGYFEHRILAGGVHSRRWCGRGAIVWRRAKQAHRLEVISGAPPTVTLFLTGPRLREWGFHCPNGWIRWQDFTLPNDKSRIGKGCG